MKKISVALTFALFAIGCGDAPKAGPKVTPVAPSPEMMKQHMMNPAAAHKADGDKKEGDAAAPADGDKKEGDAAAPEKKEGEGDKKE